MAVRRWKRVFEEFITDYSDFTPSAKKKFYPIDDIDFRTSNTSIVTLTSEQIESLLNEQIYRVVFYDYAFYSWTSDPFSAAEQIIAMDTIFKNAKTLRDIEYGVTLTEVDLVTDIDFFLYNQFMAVLNEIIFNYINDVVLKKILKQNGTEEEYEADVENIFLNAIADERNMKVIQSDLFISLETWELISTNYFIKFWSELYTYEVKKKEIKQEVLSSDTEEIVSDSE